MNVTVIPGLIPHVILGVDYLKSARLLPSAFKTVMTTPCIPHDAVLPYPIRIITKQEYETLMHAPTIRFPGESRRRIQRPDGLTTDEDSEESSVTQVSEVTEPQVLRAKCSYFTGTPKLDKRCRAAETQVIEISDTSSEQGVTVIQPSSATTTQSTTTQTSKQRKQSRKRRYRTTPTVEPRQKSKVIKIVTVVLTCQSIYRMVELLVCDYDRKQLGPALIMCMLVQSPFTRICMYWTERSKLPKAHFKYG